MDADEKSSGQEAVPVAVSLTPEMARAVKSLVSSGLFGTSEVDVVERLLAERLREVIQEGWLGAPGFPDGRTQPLVRLRG